MTRYDRATIDRALVLVSVRSEHGHRTAFKPGSRPFTPAEDATIESMRADHRGYAEIARAIGRAKSSIHSRIQTLDQIERRGGNHA